MPHQTPQQTPSAFPWIYTQPPWDQANIDNYKPPHLQIAPYVVPRSMDTTLSPSRMPSDPARIVQHINDLGTQKYLVKCYQIATNHWNVRNNLSHINISYYGRQLNIIHNNPLIIIKK